MQLYSLEALGILLCSVKVSTSLQTYLDDSKLNHIQNHIVGNIGELKNLKC